MCGRRHTYSDDGDRYGGLKHLANLQSQVGGSGRKEHSHEYSPRHRPWCDLRINALGAHHRLILLARLQLSKGVVGQFDLLVFFVFHYKS